MFSPKSTWTHLPENQSVLFWQSSFRAYKALVPFFDSLAEVEMNMLIHVRRYRQNTTATYADKLN